MRFKDNFKQGHSAFSALCPVWDSDCVPALYTVRKVYTDITNWGNIKNLLNIFSEGVHGACVKETKKSAWRKILSSSIFSDSVLFRLLTNLATLS